MKLQMDKSITLERNQPGLSWLPQLALRSQTQKLYVNGHAFKIYNLKTSVIPLPLLEGSPLGTNAISLCPCLS